MSAAQHTPGPWIHELDGTFDNDMRHGVVAACNDLWVAACYRSGTSHRDEKSAAAEAEVAANARLIAAAPDYHDATHRILSAVTNNAAPVNPMAALEEMALNGQHITLDAGLVLDLLKAHAKANGETQR